MGKFTLTLNKQGPSALHKTGRTLLLAIFAALTLSGCAFKPLYSNTASNQELVAVLSSIEVPEVPGRVGQQVRNELIFRFTGGGNAAVPQYKLVLAVQESVRSQLVQRDGDSQGQSLELKTSFKLYSITDGKTPLLSGNSHSKAAFIDDESVYANVRSRRDAENRAARTAAEDIQGRIAAFLSSNS